MRWKLIILVSLVVSLVSAGAWFALANFVLKVPLFLRDNWFYLQAAVLVIIVNSASIFVYRHTAKRRKTQAFIASILVILLIFGFLFAAQRFFGAVSAFPNP